MGILGLRTAVYRAPDLDEAKGWYSSVLGFDPYFDEPFYVGFDVGGFELGLQPDAEDELRSDTGVTVYWGVEHIEAAHERLLGLGATRHEDVRAVGGGIQVATVLDPFGNVFGIIQNPHFSAA